MRVCKGYITGIGAPLWEQAENYPSLADAAQAVAREELQSEVIFFTSVEGNGIALRTEKIDHVRVAPAEDIEADLAQQQAAEAAALAAENENIANGTFGRIPV